MNRGSFRVICEQSLKSKHDNCYVYAKEFEVYIPKTEIKRVVKILNVCSISPSYESCESLYVQLHKEIGQCCFCCDEVPLVDCLAKNNVVVYRLYTSKSKSYILHYAEKDRMESYLRGDDY